MGDNVQSPADLSRPLEAGSIHLGYKRQRSPAVGSAKNSSGRHQIKRRPPEIRLTQVPVSHAVEISDRCLGHNGQSNQFCTTYDAVFALLTDLLRIKSQDIDIKIDDHTSTLIRELSEFLTRLEITGMRLTPNDFYGHDIVATDLNNQEIVLASLTSFKPMSSIGELASHLFDLVRLQNLQSATISTVPVNNPCLPAYIITDDKSLRSWTVNNINTNVSTPDARQYGLTFPSAFLDVADLSNYSTII